MDFPLAGMGREVNSLLRSIEESIRQNMTPYRLEPLTLGDGGSNLPPVTLAGHMFTKNIRRAPSEELL